MKKFLSLFLVAVLIMAIGLTGCYDSSDTTNKPVKNAAKDEPKTDDPGTKPNDNTNEPADTTVDVTKLEFKQSPMLDGNAGLPAVNDRLPEVPKLTNEMPADALKYEIGKYGGVLRTVTSVVDWDADVFVMNNEPLLNTPGILGKEITGNVLESYEVSPDEKQFTFHMRKGLKWSDGQPVTTEDVRFTVEDVLFNKEITPIFPDWLKSGGTAKGTPMKFEKMNDFTFKLSFDQPYGGLLIRLAIQGWRGYTELVKPAHFLKQFHKTYTPLDKLEPLIKKGSFKKGDWVSLFNDKDITNWELTNVKAIGFPVLYPWMLVKKEGTKSIFERNPYYFKVDAAGNQLPYIDRIESSLVQNIEMVTMKTIAGEVDFSRESAALVKMPLYRENEKNGYKALLTNMHVTPTDVFLNLTYNDPNWQKVVQDIRFRKALNYALNRDEVIDSIYYGFAEPSSFEDPTFDLKEANKLLDEMGMKKGSDGFRLGPDGKKFVIQFEVGAQAPDIVPMTELISELWKELGINVTMKTIDQTLWGTRVQANQIKATVIWTATPLWYYGDWGQGFWAPLWNKWQGTDGKEGKEPPQEAKDFYAMIQKASVQSPADAAATIEELKKSMGENLWYFTPISNVKQPLIVNSKLHNVTDKGFAIAVNFSGEQLWFEN